MILTGKAKEDFNDWYWNVWFEDKERYAYQSKEEALYALNYTDVVFMNAILIEWFDSVWIYVSVYFKYIWRVEIRDSETNLLSTLDYNVFDTRQEATKQAIIKANEIYNETTIKRNGIQRV